MYNQYKRLLFGIFASVAVVTVAFFAWSKVMELKEKTRVARELLAAYEKGLTAHLRDDIERYGWDAKDFFSDAKTIEVCHAIESNDLSKIDPLLSTGVDVNQQGTGGVTLLYWAYFARNIEAFKLLLEKGADPDQKITGLFRRLGRDPIRRGDSVFLLA